MVWYGPGGLGTYSTIDAFDTSRAHLRKSLQAGVMGKQMELPGSVLIARRGTATTHFSMVGK